MNGLGSAKYILWQYLQNDIFCIFGKVINNGYLIVLEEEREGNAEDSFK